MIGFVYKITDNTCGSVYYGSTITTISRRMVQHRSDYKRWVGGKGGGCKSFDIIKNEDYSCSHVEQVEFENKMELHMRERWYIENNECINKLIPARSQDEKIENQKVYYDKNKEQILEKKKEYYERNKEQICEQRKQYRQRNKERIREYKKEYYQRKKAEKENLIII